MTAKQFIKKIQEYYGPYPKGQRQDIADYLFSKPDNYLDKLYIAVRNSFSSTWGKVPDIAIFEKYRAGIWDEINHKPKKLLTEQIDPVQHEKVKNMLITFLNKLKNKELWR